MNGERKTLKQRLSFKGLGCFGATWSPGSTPLTQQQQRPAAGEEEDDDDQPTLEYEATRGSTDDHRSVAGHGGMNLAMALARERSSRGEEVVAPTTSTTKSLMRLIEETDGVDLRGTNSSGDHNYRREKDWVCCVCMDRSKGAAFIPCGHAFCRVCSRELWVNRGSCPICNRSILDVLPIF